MRNKFISFLLVILIFPGINIEIATANGENWTARTQASNSSWYSITYGNGLFVAVSLNGTVMTSPDGITWTSRTAAASNQWTAITYGNGLFVAVGPTGTNNRVMTSPDGINWTSRTSAADYEWRGIAYGNGVFVAVNWNGNGNKVMTSSDGITWTLRPSAVLGNWMDITYGNSLFVAVSYDGSHQVMTSPDGITWTAQAAASTNEWFGVTYGNNLYVAVSRSGTNNRVMTSPNGVNWTSRTSASNNNWYDVTYGSGVFVAVSYDGTGNQVMTSTDGSNWSTRNSPAGVRNNWRSVTYGAGLFVAVNESGTNHYVMTSGTYLAPPAFTLSSASESKTVNTAISGYTITSTGGTIASYSISPAAPAGLTFNTTTGLLSGTPTEIAAATAYTITATNTSGTAQRTFTLTVGPVAPAFTISSASESKTVNTAISGYTISSTGGTIASYSISPAAPAGLTFNTITGLLSGTPTEVAAATAYTITATNATSSTTQTFTLTITAVPVVATNSAAEAAAQAEAARRANEQRQMGDLSSVLPLINELIKEIEDGLKSTSAPKKKTSTSKTQQSSKAKPEKKSNSESLPSQIPPATEPEAQSQVGEVVSISHKVGFGLSASWINSSNIKALRDFIAGIEESFDVEKIVIQGYAQPTKIGLSDIDIARAKAVKKLLIKDGLDYPMVVEGMGQAESKKGDLSRIAVVTIEGKYKNQN